MWLKFCMGMLLLLCGANLGLAQAADPAPRVSWSVIAGNEYWTAPTAVAGGGENWASVQVTCGGDGRPIMAVAHDSYPGPQGQFISTGEIDGQTFSVTWSGWKIFAVTNPDAALLNLLRSGRKMILYSQDGLPVDFDLSGAQQAVDAALAPCVSAPKLQAQPPATDMRSDLVAKVTAELQAICASDHAKTVQIRDGAFQDTLRMNSQNPDIVVDFSFVQCVGDTNPGAGFCDKSKCLHRRYLPGTDAYFLSDIFVQ